MKYAIETFDLTKDYGDFTAVDALNMKIKEKSIFGFLGPNGAGKTTTIKMLTCLIQPTQGTARVAGYDVRENPNEVRKKIGMVPQLVSLYGDLTVRENVELCADYYGMPRELKKERIVELMELVDIKYAEDKMVKQLSGGQKQKVSVVASLVHQPDILFLDEPTIGLDPSTKRVLWDLIYDLNEKGHTIVLCSHDMYEVELLCDNVGIINQGKLAAFNTPQSLKDSLIEKNTRDIPLENISTPEKEEKVENKQMSIMVTNLNKDLIKEIEGLPAVCGLKEHSSGRIIMDMEDSSSCAVNDVIETVLKNQGNITSIATRDPSLEDVFMKVTGKDPGE